MKALPEDTIAAISTALGPGAIALVRLSGAGAIKVADSVFRGSGSLRDCRSHTVHHGHIVDKDGCEVDDVLATVMHSPNTYTTEHMIEFGCHGGPVPARRVLAICLASGARLARRGEFTERAFLNGRLDLVQAEAVADVVAAETPRALTLALRQLDGRLSGRLKDLRETLVDLRAETETLIDFPEDSTWADSEEQLESLLGRAAGVVDDLLENSETGAAVRDGIAVAIVGKPNVGKSSLMNALLERDRSIVTAEPGTTRDAIEDCLHVAGVSVRLVDTAGWREPGSEAERAGVARAVAAVAAASIALWVVDGSSPLDADDARVARSLDPALVVTVANKQDLGRTATPTAVDALLNDDGDGDGARSSAAELVWVSALTGDGVDGLRSRLTEACLGAEHGGDADVSNVRHIEALRDLKESLTRACALVASAAAPELLSVEVAEATDALGEITGETTPEDVIERIFERFCVGK